MILPVVDHELKEVTLSDALPRTAAFFSEDTPLKRAEEYGGRPYERREQQTEMACAVAEAFQNGRNLMVEAPTGVGKSFAYLVPAIYHAKAMHQWHSRIRVSPGSNFNSTVLSERSGNS